METLLTENNMANRLGEVGIFVERFVHLLEAAGQEDPKRFREIPGAFQSIQRFSGEKDYRVAFASGGWKVSALFKLKQIGIFGDRYPAAFADDATSRTRIMTTAIERSKAQYDADEFTRIIYVGDGEWDAKACLELRIPFIARAKGDRAKRLKELGASGVIEDLDSDQLVRLIDQIQ